MQKITPCIWFDNQAEEATNFYVSIFKNGKIGKTVRYDKASAEVSGQPEGSVLTVEFELAGCSFLALNGGPVFKLNPAISFTVNCETEEEIDELWKNLSEGGFIMMPYEKYPFSEKFGWVQDKYGVSWQLSLSRVPQKIVTSFLFTGEEGKTEEAINFYTSVFENSNIIHMDKYGPDDTLKEGMVRFAMFSLSGQEFTAMDGGPDHKFTFTPAVSLIIDCTTQEEVDKFWNKLSAVPEAEQCGWLQDKFGVSWQVVPSILNKLLSDPDKEKSGRVMKAMLEMKKIDISELEKASNADQK